MVEKVKTGTLGRGLSALFGEDAEETAAAVGGRTRDVTPDQLFPSPLQPRRQFAEDALADLAASIAERGVLQPLLVREAPDGRFEIIAGERRWRAAQRAGVHELPVLLCEFSDREVLEVALIENLQRQDLTPIEEATGYKRLMEEFSHTQEALATAVGKSRSHVANMMRLLALPEPVREMLEDGRLSTGHARALLGMDNATELARQVARKGLSVRQTEKLVKKPARAKRQSQPTQIATEKDVDTLALERDLQNLLGLKVDIAFTGEAGGSVTLHYSTLDQLDDILRRLNSDGGNTAF